MTDTAQSMTFVTEITQCIKRILVYHARMTTRDEDKPYCKNCGYSLLGLTESSKCPECGKPLVEILTRDSLEGGRRGKRWKSQATWFGLPVVAIATGPYGSEKMGRPKGIIAIGDIPTGVIAIGAFPLGVVAIGSMSRGIISFGGLAVGLISIGGMAAGILACGGMAFGGWSFGGGSFYFVNGWGGLAKKIPLF
jgi:predicted RNA-binding Zn-ribbon protein involved in translation (DUF1610 family)